MALIRRHSQSARALVPGKSLLWKNTVHFLFKNVSSSDSMRNDKLRFQFIQSDLGVFVETCEWMRLSKMSTEGDRLAMK